MTYYIEYKKITARRKRWTVRFVEEDCTYEEALESAKALAKAYGCETRVVKKKEK